MWIRGRNKIRFERADYEESWRQLNNPGCGWYHVYPFQVSPADEGPEKSADSNKPGQEGIDGIEELAAYLPEMSKDEQLALVLIDIGVFGRCELPKEATAYIERILKLFHRYEKQMILRFTYDTEGKGLGREPLEISMVKRHMGQLGDLIEKYAEDILVLQGIFVGSWGEMHGSKFLSAYSMTELINTLYTVTRGTCYLAVRTPAQWRKITACPILKPGVRERLALFNDGIFGSLTDLGTYGSKTRKEAGETEGWSREEELDWQKNHMESVPCGGEAVAGGQLTGYEQAVREMKKMHLSYLNSTWQKEQLDHWKSEQLVCRGNISGYDYIGLHLGYRFVVRSVRRGLRGGFQIEVENCGFAGLREEAECFLVIRQKNGSIGREQIETDAREWKSGERVTLKTAFPERWEQSEGCRVYLQLQRKRDGRNLQFANQNVCDMVLLGEFTDA